MPRMPQISWCMRRLLSISLLVLAGPVGMQQPARDSIPLPEQPRPDFERTEWLNLNGTWRFAFDSADVGERSGWFNGDLPGALRILVPFSWGAPLSGIPDSAAIGWYARPITIPD